MENDSLVIAALAGVGIVFVVKNIFKFRKVKEDLSALIDQGATIIDVRTSEEFRAGSNPKSINIPLGIFENKIKSLDKNRTYILCCASGGRSGSAEKILKTNGFASVYNVGPWTNTIVRG